MNPPPKKPDKIEDIIKRIMSDPVPKQGQLVHPTKKVTKLATTKSNNLDTIKNFKFPNDIKLWTPKIFVDYFAKRYNEDTGGNYRCVYRSDNMLIQQMGDFLVSNGMDRNYWTKKLIDWALRKREDIVRKHRHFTLQEVLNNVNYFYQQEILPKVEDDEIERDTEDTVLLEEIQTADEDGKITEVFVRFGIPVAITYLVNLRNVPLDKILKATDDRLKAFFGGNTIEKQQMEKIFQASIIGSPYPSEFCALNWRDLFKTYTKKCNQELWWREEDYKGKPLAKYYSLIDPEE